MGSSCKILAMIASLRHLVRFACEFAMGLRPTYRDESALLRSIDSKRGYPRPSTECVRFPGRPHPRKSGPSDSNSLAVRARRPQLSVVHKLFWIALRRLWAGWKNPLIVVRPRTVVEWHRAGFRLCWKWLSRARQSGGRLPYAWLLFYFAAGLTFMTPRWAWR